MGAPIILRAETLGLNGRIGPNSRIGLAYIGLARQMGNYHGLVSRDGVEPLFVYDVKFGRLVHAVNAMKKRGFDNVEATLYYEDVMNRDAVNAVVICTPDHWHAALAIEAMRNGKDAYVEKPMTLTIEEGKAMVEAEKCYGRVLQIGHNNAPIMLFARPPKWCGMAG